MNVLLTWLIIECVASLAGDTAACGAAAAQAGLGTFTEHLKI